MIGFIDYYNINHKRIIILIIIPLWYKKKNSNILVLLLYYKYNNILIENNDHKPYLFLNFVIWTSDKKSTSLIIYIA